VTYISGKTLNFLSDGVEASDEKAHIEGLEYLRTNYEAEIKSVEEMMESWHQLAKMSHNYPIFVVRNQLRTLPPSLPDKIF
jgi:hypothetical protein